MSSLAAVEVKVHFAGVKAVDGVDLQLAKGEILGLIGPNGAGKTTLVNALSGFQRLTEGAVELRGDDITDWSSHRRVRNGVVRSFQAVRLFPRLSVFENVEAAALAARRNRSAARRRTRELLIEFGLADRADVDAAVLPHGEERRVGIVRALATEPEFLLLDEPAAGLNEHESDELGDMLRTIRDDVGCGLCVIEHDMRLIMSRCDRIHVLAFGQTLAVGPPAAVRTNPAVIEAYLGAA